MHGGSKPASERGLHKVDAGKRESNIWPFLGEMQISLYLSEKLNHIHTMRMHILKRRSKNIFILNQKEKCTRVPMSTMYLNIHIVMFIYYQKQVTYGY